MQVSECFQCLQFFLWMVCRKWTIGFPV